MDAHHFRQAGHQAIEKIADYYENIQRYSIKADVQPGFLRESIPAVPPEKSEPWAAIYQDLERFVEPGLGHWSHPGFMAYFPASSTFEGILGELYSAAFNGPAFDWSCSPSVTELENIVVGWLAKLLSLPEAFQAGKEEQSKGIIMTSTTECVLATMVAARDQYFENYASADVNSVDQVADSRIKDQLVVLGSSETHASTEKAASIIGVKYRSIDCSPVDGTVMTGEKLANLIHQCEAECLIPFFLTATMGTTSTCGIDDFKGLATVLSDFPDIWVHVDAAFAGAALACKQYQYLAADMNNFHSLSINLGKWLLTNLDCTVLFVRQPTNLANSLSITAPILEKRTSGLKTVVDYRNWQLSMGRRFRALKVWFVLRSWGTSGIERHIVDHIAMADQFTSWLRRRPDLFSIVCKPQFALNVIRVSDRWAEHVMLTPDQATLIVFNDINETGDFWLSKTLVHGQPAIRIIGANLNTNIERFNQLYGLLVRFTSALEFRNKNTSRM